MDDVELLLIRIDRFQDRTKYLSVLREWLKELQIVNGRMISMGTDLQLLFVAASEAQNSQLLEFYNSRDIDTNSRGEMCVDKFIDVLGRKKVPTDSSCKGFMEMNVLSPKLLQKLLVLEWQVEQEWLDTALATPRTKAFLEWREAAKAARKERRKREGMKKQQQRDKKRMKREKEAAQKKSEEAASTKEEKTGGDVKEDKPVKTEEVTERHAMPTVQLPQKQQQSLGQKEDTNKRREKVSATGKQS